MINLKFLKENDIKAGLQPEVVNFINVLYDSSLKMYIKQHKDWYINDRFLRGDHWVVFNKSLNRVQPVPISQGEVRRTVNKIRSQVRGIKNFIKRSQPRWEVHPASGTDEAYEEAEKKNKILQHVYKNSQIKRELTKLIVNSLKYSTAFLEGGMIKDGGKDRLMFWVNSSYDIVPDPYATCLDDCRFYFKTFSKTVSSIKENKDYVVEDSNLSDNKDAASEYKNILEQEKFSKEGNKTGDDLETAIVKELWMKWQENGKTKIRVYTIAGNNVLRVHNPKYRRYPMFEYSPETADDTIFGQPWIKDLISVNKSLDKTVSQIEAYIQRMLAGKWLVKQGVEVSSVTDKGAEKIYYKGMVPPKQLDLQALPSTPFSFVDRLEQWIEELGGVREASLGRAAGSLQSGRGVEALQAADAGTVAEPIENLELLLQRVGEFSLEIIADYNIASDIITEDGEDIKYIGSSAENTLEDAIVIDGTEKVKVEIVPEVAYSDEAKKTWVMRLAEAGLIDQQTLLEQFKFSNISDIIERMEKQKGEEFKQEIVKQRESHRTDGGGPEDTADLADQENMQLSSGQDVPLTPQALWTPEHLDLHMAFIQENADAYEQNKELFRAHITNEENYGNQ